MKAFSKFIVGPSFGVATWAGTAFIPVVGPWSPVLGLAVAFVLCACPFPSWAAIGRLRPRSPVRRGSFVSVDVPALYEEGLGIRSVAEELGRSYSTARRE